MTDSSDNARDFVRRLAAFAERLAGRNVVVRRLVCDWSHMGSWILHASNGDAEELRAQAIRERNFRAPGPEVVRVTWDGRERILCVETSPSGVLSEMNKWERQVQRKVDLGVDAMSFAEEDLMTRLGSSPQE
jgi:hypothetical protein